MTMRKGSLMTDNAFPASVDFAWCVLGDAPDEASEDIWHAVRPLAATTVCGEAAADRSEEWRWSEGLGRKRPCDNCTRLIALAVDVPAL